ncbi:MULTISPECIES: hypothetical protein [unclassified Vibrio]|uniref:hypothetical protein n=1 Tax=unclassified Vibrio TaxID=2614977 RepID=UPI0025528EF1|nr:MULTISPECIES: hypothetical protein [unclassified Vibrio]MDK9778559.1 hypothetical protein [Vibrio sp. D401a]MDK9803692.1 hypothetical protein [Vibrio sp. D406a]
MKKLLIVAAMAALTTGCVTNKAIDSTLEMTVFDDIFGHEQESAEVFTNETGNIFAKFDGLVPVFGDEIRAFTPEGYEKTIENIDMFQRGLNGDLDYAPLFYGSYVFKGRIKDGKRYFGMSACSIKNPVARLAVCRDGWTYFDETNTAELRRILEEYHGTQK